MALAAGDQTPFEDFVRTEVGAFMGFFQRLGADPQEAEDLTQDVFLKLFRHAPTYDPRERFAAYSLRVARNAWIDCQRRAERRGPRATGHGGLDQVGGDTGDATDRAAAPERDAEALLGEREESRRMHVALAALPESQRAVFELGALQELSYAEVSGLLDIPVGTVKSRMFHAVRRLRDALQPGTPFEADRAASSSERPS